MCKNQAKYWRGGRGDVILSTNARFYMTSFVKCFHLLILSVSSPLEHLILEAFLLGLDMSGVRLQQTYSTLVAGNKFGSAKIYKNIVLKREGLREHESRSSDDSRYDD